MCARAYVYLFVHIYACMFTFACMPHDEPRYTHKKQGKRNKARPRLNVADKQHYNEDIASLDQHWWGFTTAQDRDRLERLMGRCGMKICLAWSAVRKTSNINIDGWDKCCNWFS